MISCLVLRGDASQIPAEPLKLMPLPRKHPRLGEQLPPGPFAGSWISGCSCMLGAADRMGRGCLQCVLGLSSLSTESSAGILTGSQRLSGRCPLPAHQSHSQVKVSSETTAGIQTGPKGTVGGSKQEHWPAAYGIIGMRCDLTLNMPNLPSKGESVRLWFTR